MPKTNVPDRLKPKTLELEDPQIVTDLTIDRTYDPQQLNSLRELGLIKVDGERFKSLAEVGRAARSLGIVNFVNGGFAISLDSLTQAMAMCARIVTGEPDEEGKVPSRSDKMEAAKLSGYLAGQLSKAAGSVTKVQQVQVQAIEVADRQRRQSFAPGMAIPIESLGKTPVPA